VVTDPEIIALSLSTGVPAAKIQANVQMEQNIEFTDLVSELPEDEANKLTFAYYNPEAATNLSPELKAKLTTIKEQIHEGVKDVFKFSPEWQGVAVDATDFKNKFSTEVDNTFQAALDALVEAKLADGSLKLEDVAAFKATMRSMHLGLAAGPHTLQNLLKTLEGQVSTQLQAKYGFDVAYQPKGDILFYNNVVNGSFSQTYQQLVAKYTGQPPANAQQLADLEKYADVIAKNPNDPAIPASIKQIVADRQLLLKAYPDFSGLPDNLQAVAKQIRTDSVKAVISQFGLDTTWEPTIKSIIIPGVDMQKVATLNTGLATAREGLGKVTEYANSLPDSPEKVSFLNYLGIISAAISGLQEAVYAMQASQSNAMSASTRGKLDMQLNDLAQTTKASKATQEQLKKMASMENPGMKALMWIVKIVLLLISIWFGPFAFAAALAFFTDSVVAAATGEKHTGLEKLMELMSKNLPPAAAAALKIIMVLAIGAVNPWLALEIFATESGTVKDTMKAFGADDKAAAIADMVFKAVLMVAIMVVMVVVTGGAATEAVMLGVFKMIADALHVATKVAVRIVQIATLIMNTVIASIQVSASAVTMNNSIIMSKIDMIKGESEAYAEIVAGMIAAIQKLIQKLLALMQQGASSIVMINEFQGKKWTNASQISSDICA
ncbi:MAG TPA: hypothetical protein VGP47_01095, partial [Parachlamydiaceae bacterium]|nr:hypothetical protein [Parachlamydiaceae bacterium]